VSVTFGVCLPPNSLVDDSALLDLAAATARYGMDGTNIRVCGRIGMGFQAFHTHSRSRIGHQPSVDQQGNVLVFDGRLDNHRELASGDRPESISDSALVFKAFAQWGEGCFSHLIGDWALALWSETDHILYLARDHAGSRTLYYKNINGHITWSTYLETFLIEDPVPKLDQEYVARVLAAQEIGDLTPYQGVRAVPPAHYVTIRKGEAALRPHWNWIADRAITYRSDDEYDEHFLCLFRQAVQRRIEPVTSVLAQLSGGMDSSSIVCMADVVVRDSSEGSDLIDTISYYNDTEPDWDERPYFAAVERRRNKKGIHIDCSSQRLSYEPLVVQDRIYPYPGGESSSLNAARDFESRVGPGRYRSILSGVGGDELLGGVPTPIPELADYLRAGRLIKLLSRAIDWCMVDRRPLMQTLHQTVTFAGSLYRSTHRAPFETVPPWLSPSLRRICLRFGPYRESKYDPLRTLPSAINAGRVWWAMLETLPHATPQLLSCYEYRYPYLDRDLVDFLQCIPRDQLVRPGRRRCLMRRALQGIVPIEVLERKRKACLSRGPIAEFRRSQQKIERLFSNALSVEYGLVDRDKFLFAFRAELSGDLRWIAQLTRTIGIELWLRSLEASGLCFDSPDGIDGRKFRPVFDEPNEIRAADVRTWHLTRGNWQ
jgi:asparagine synthase (glutamine-hydrolysing)